ncbi:HLA class II histocompatibility antigen, DM beta chain-like [Varanus komodoensis]|uniref:HLA class II histocompatibility antigen, DM beta chain-like n=1 Tax=Varanus komodoensis TaxID=61221 RepID=UPI001CF7A651|nr:HLA class II histocompatibility antigen, DM beta chain-like [Varanus komodoensis]
MPRLPLLGRLPPGCGSEPHGVFRTIYTSVSEPGPALPDFTAVVYMNDLPAAHYDSDTRKVGLHVPWTRKMLEEHPEHRKRYTQQDEVELIGGMKTLQTIFNQSAEPPKMKLTRKAGQDDTETLPCWAHGFYPREIDMAWTRDGEVWLPDTFRGVLAPNSDGTYHAWVGIRIDPAERGRFRCRVGHDALPEPLNLAWEEPGGTCRKGYRGASQKCHWNPVLGDTLRSVVPWTDFNRRGVLGSATLQELKCPFDFISLAPVSVPLPPSSILEEPLRHIQESQLPLGGEAPFAV